MRWRCIAMNHDRADAAPAADHDQYSIFSAPYCDVFEQQLAPVRSAEELFRERKVNSAAKTPGRTTAGPPARRPQRAAAVDHRPQAAPHVRKNPRTADEGLVEGDDDRDDECACHRAGGMASRKNGTNRRMRADARTARSEEEHLDRPAPVARG
jgi:hypothetical protein